MPQTRAAGFLDVVPFLGRIVFTAITQALTYPFRSVRCNALYNDVLYAAIRCGLDNITIPQARYLSSNTGARYVEHCTSLSIPPETIHAETSDGRKVAAHWIGRSDAETVILYLHGGGYTQPASQANFLYATRLIKDLNGQKDRRSVAMLMLEYTLVPEGKYPTQLREAVAMLAHLLANTGYTPSDIFISGDSAGGNLGTTLLSHLLHPHPDVPAVELSQPLAGALLYSPWVGFNTDYASFDNVKLDMLSPLVLRKWSAMLMDKANPVNPEADPGPVTGDEYTEVCKNPSSWWNGMQNICSDYFVCYGGDEVLAGPIEEWEGPLKKGWTESGGDSSRVVFIKAAHEAHVAPVFDIMAPGKSETKSSTQTAIEEWLKARLSR